MLVPFITRTVMIRMLGTEYTGLSSLFSSILGVLTLSELGFGTAMTYSMYKPVAENDIDTICALLSLYKKVYRVIGIVIFSGGLLVLPFLGNFISGSCPENVNIYVIYLILIF